MAQEAIWPGSGSAASGSTPFGFYDADYEPEDSFVDNEGDLWKVDEYGDRSYMWEYR